MELKKRKEPKNPSQAHTKLARSPPIHCSTSGQPDDPLGKLSTFRHFFRQCSHKSLFLLVHG